MLSDKDLTLLLDLINAHRKNVNGMLTGSAQRVYIKEADDIAAELVTMRDAYRKSVASLTLTHTGRRTA